MAHEMREVRAIREEGRDKSNMRVGTEEKAGRGQEAGGKAGEQARSTPAHPGALLRAWRGAAARTLRRYG